MHGVSASTNYKDYKLSFRAINNNSIHALIGAKWREKIKISETDVTMDHRVTKEDSITSWKLNHCSRTQTPNESKTRTYNIRVNNITSAAHNGQQWLGIIDKKWRSTIFFLGFAGATSTHLNRRYCFLQNLLHSDNFLFGYIVYILQSLIFEKIKWKFEACILGKKLLGICR